ncbi:MAG TPA: hypothetical protein VNJ46_10355, partial [Gaiellaceae bacterium]|nr:hypothetical protein [Gaiellaceae bacterium]
LFAGIATRPAGGLLARRVRERALVAAALAGSSLGASVLALGGPLPLSAAAALLLGLAAGLPFGSLFAAAQRLRPDAPAAAASFVNGCAILAILAGTPLAGLAFALPGEGRLAFAALALLGAFSLLAVRAADLDAG